MPYSDELFTGNPNDGFFRRHNRITALILTIISITLLIILITNSPLTENTTKKPNTLPTNDNKTEDNTNENNKSKNPSQLNPASPNPPNPTPSNINDNSLKLEMFPESTSAKCIDGTPYGVYFAHGYATGENKVIINFWGGAWCSGRNETSFLSSCAKRRNEDYGSSNYFKSQYKYVYDFFGEEESKNKYFFNWNKFDIPYCDGTGAQGRRSEPIISSNNTKYYFRGFDNTVAALEHLFAKLDLMQLETIVVSGCSSGGLSAMYWLQYIADALGAKGSKAAVLGINIGGFITDYKNIKTNDKDFGLRMKQMYELVNKEASIVNKDCLAEHVKNPYVCFLPEILVKYIKVPLLLFQAAYDSYILTQVLGETCYESDYKLNNCNEDQKNQINKMKDYNKKLLLEAAKSKSNLSVWSPMCIFHCFWNILRDSASFAVDGVTINNAIGEFLNSKGQKQVLLFDKVESIRDRECPM